MPKIEILPMSGQEAFDSPPKFSEPERRKYFNLPAALKVWLKTMAEPTNQVGFILLWGYCKKSSRFYQPSLFAHQDILSACRQYGLNPDEIDFGSYRRRTFNSHKHKIRESLGLKRFDDWANNILIKIIQERAARHQSPKLIFQEATELLRAKNIEVPGYNRFALAITKATADFEKDTSDLLSKKLDDEQKRQLDAFLTASPSSTSLVTWLKTINHSRKPRAIKDAVQAFKLLKEQYIKLSPEIEIMGLHGNTIKYCATWVRKASFHQINQMQLNKRYFYLTCFIIHQYRLRQDILADILLTSVQATQNAIARAQKEIGFKQSVLQNKALSLLSFARVSYKDLLKQIEAVAIDHSLNDANKITQIKKLLDDYQKKTTELNLDEVEKNSMEQIAEQDYHQILDGLSLRLQNRVSDILRYLSFETSDIKEPSPILNAVKYYQKKIGCISKEAPVDFLDTETCKKLWTQEGKFRVSLYKALLFFHLAESLKSGAISLAPAYRYLSGELFTS